MIHPVPAATYHADDVGTARPSLSSSIAHVLCTQSPRHAWTQHPRLNPEYVYDSDPKFDIGNVAHSMILEGVDVVERGDYLDWRTNEAKAWRADVYSRGKIPLLAAQYKAVGELVVAAMRQIGQHRADPPLLREGKPELVAVWEEEDVACRARIDWLRADVVAIDDLKTTSRSADPQTYARNLYAHGGDVQAAFYLRGVEKLTGSVPAFRWIVVETDPPYALSVISPSADVLAVGNAKVEYALELWSRLLELEDEWPAYSLDVVRAELPPWEESRWLERVAT